MAHVKIYFPKTRLSASLGDDGRWSVSGPNADIGHLFLKLLRAFDDKPTGGRVSRKWAERTACRVAHRFGGEIVEGYPVAPSFGKVRRLVL